MQNENNESLPTVTPQTEPHVESQSYAPITPTRQTYLNTEPVQFTGIDVNKGITSKAERLARRRNQKLDGLQDRTGFSETDLTDTRVELNGSIEHLGNAIVNNYSQAEIYALIDRAVDEYGLTRGDDGKFYKKNSKGVLEEYKGDLNDYGSLYEFGTFNGDRKLGIWMGRDLDPKSRYDQEFFDRANARNRLRAEAEGRVFRPDGVGPEGVNIEDLRRDHILPRRLVTILEGIQHGSLQAMENRVARNMADRPVQEYYDARDRIGSGASEAYRVTEDILPEGADVNALWKEFTEQFGIANTPQTREDRLAMYRQMALEMQADRMGVAGRTVNFVKGFTSALVRSLAVDSTAALGELTGAWSMGTAESRRDMVADWFGYNQVPADRAMAAAAQEVEQAYKHYQETGELDWAAARSAVWHGLTPEVVGDSIATTVGMILGLGKFTNTGRAINAVEKSYRAAPTAANAALAKARVAAIKREASLVQSASYLAANNAGFAAVVAGMTNNQVEEFRENNEGVVTPLDVARITAVTTVAFGVERLAGTIILRDVPGVRRIDDVLTKMGMPFVRENVGALKTAVAAMSPEQYRKVAQMAFPVMAAGARAIAAGSSEAVIEYAQTLSEVFNTRYATETFGKDIAEILLSDSAQIEAFTGSAVGAGAGASMSVFNSMVQAGQSAAVAYAGKEPNESATPAGEQLEESVAPVIEETPEVTDNVRAARSNYEQTVSRAEEAAQIDADINLYASTLFRLDSLRADTALVPEELPSYITDMNTLRRTRYALAEADPAKVAAVDAILKDVEKAIAKMVVEHADGSIKFTSVLTGEVLGSGPESAVRPMSKAQREGVITSVTEIVARETSGNVDPTVAAKLRVMATVNDVSPELVDFTIKNFDTVEAEASVGKRGYVARLSELSDMVNSANVPVAALRKGYNEAVSFYLTTRESIKALEQGIKEAETLVATLNNNPVADKSKRHAVTTNYRKVDGGVYAIEVVHTDALGYNGNKWVATGGIKDARQRIEAKQRTQRGLEKLLEAYHEDAAPYLENNKLIPVETRRQTSDVPADTAPAEVVVSTSVDNATLSRVPDAPVQQELDLSGVTPTESSPVTPTELTTEEVEVLTEVLAETSVEPTETSAEPVIDPALEVSTEVLDEGAAAAVKTATDPAAAITETKTEEVVDEVLQTYDDNLEAYRNEKGKLALLRKEFKEANTEFKKARDAAPVKPSTPSKKAPDRVKEKYVKKLAAFNDAQKEVEELRNAKKELADRIEAQKEVTEKSLKTFQESKKALMARRKKEERVQEKKDRVTAAIAAMLTTVPQTLSDVKNAVKELQSALAETSSSFVQEEFNSRVSEILGLVTGHPKRKDLEKDIGAALSLFADTDKAAEAKTEYVRALMPVVEQVLAKELGTETTLSPVALPVVSEAEKSFTVTYEEALTYLQAQHLRLQMFKAGVQRGNKTIIDARKELQNTEVLAAALAPEATIQKVGESLDTVTVDEDAPAALDNLKQEVLDIVTDMVEQRVDESVVADELSTRILNAAKNYAKDDAETYISALEALKDMTVDLSTSEAVGTDALLEAWNVGAKRKATGNAMLGLLNKALAPFNRKVVFTQKRGRPALNVLVAGKQARSIIENSVGATTGRGKSEQHVYYVEGYDGYGRGVSSVKSKADTAIAEVTKGLNKDGSGEGRILRVQPLTTNPSNYLKVGRSTVFNTIPADQLPSVFRKAEKAFRDAFLSVVAPLEKAEVSTKTKDPKRFYGYDSPARRLIFDANGNVHASMTTAMAVALHEVVGENAQQLLEGPKDTATLARMFHVQDFEVTEEMREVGEQYGLTLKTLTDKLGKAVLGSLGIVRDTSSEVGRGQYEMLVADLGNHVVRTAEAMGIVKLKAADFIEMDYLLGSKSTAEEFGEVQGSSLVDNTVKEDPQDDRSAGPKTWFVSIERVETPEGYRPTAPAQSAISTLRQMKEKVTNPTGSVKGPYQGQVPEAVKRNAMHSIRKNQAQGKVPRKARQALEEMMETPYEMQMDVANAFFTHLSDPEKAKTIKASMGYVDTSRVDPENPESDYVDPKYGKMLYEDKLIQVAINEHVERSIEYLSELHKDLRDGVIDNEMFFAYFYTVNHRYMMDSNTIQPQGDKLHRFIVTPVGHKVAYMSHKKDHRFEAEVIDRSGNKVTKDVSLYVRAALAQAMGEGIDKKNTQEIIAIGNTLLSLPASQLDAFTDTMLKEGKVSINVEGAVRTFKLDHVSHFLGAVDFLKKYHDSSDGTFTSSLTAESDALTSGFANKLQQFGWISEDAQVFPTHIKRVGIVDPATMEEYKENSPNGTFGTNDLLADSSNRDSYQNLAAGTIAQINNLMKALPPSSVQLFEAIMPSLPGGSQIGKLNPEITSDLRNLFKPAFMIFNYSAGINRIVKNLTNKLALTVLSDVAAEDLSKGPSPAAVELSKAVKMTPAELQVHLRTKDLGTLTASYPTVDRNGDIKWVTGSLVQYLEDRVIKPTYGSAVSTTFAKEFAFFTHVQDATNDVFKLMYAAFNRELQAKVSAFRAQSNNAVVTEEIFAGMVKELKDVFPVIAGPLSEALDEGVHVYQNTTEEVGSGFGGISSGRFKNADGETVKHGTRAIIRQMTAAANAGSVLPFHAIDGAQLAESLLLFKEKMWKDAGIPVIPVHDAVLAPLPYFDDAAYYYNETTVEIHKTYSLIDELVAMAERLKATAGTWQTAPSPLDGLKMRDTDMDDSRFATRKDLLKAVRNAKTQEERIIARNVLAQFNRNAYSFDEDVDVALHKLKRVQENIIEGRKQLYTDGTHVGSMVGLVESTYIVNEAGDGVSQLKLLEDEYSNVPAELAGYGTYNSLGNVDNIVDYVLTEKNELRKSGDEATWGKVAPLTKLATRVLSKIATTKPYTGDDVVLVLEESASTVKSPEKQWPRQLKEAEKALLNNANLLFSADVLTAQSVIDAESGEAFIYSELMASDKYWSMVVDVDGSTAVLVGKRGQEYAEPTVKVKSKQAVTKKPVRVKSTNTEKGLMATLQKLSERCK